MKKYAKLPTMHIDNCLVDLGEFYMSLTVHGMVIKIKMHQIS